MKAMTYTNFGEQPFIEEVKDPVANHDGVVVKVLASGICRSDWHGWMGHDSDIRLPHVPGHELVGEIVEIGKSIRNFKIGQRITVPFVSGCGRCTICISGNHQICDHQFQPGFTAWGSFAQYVALDYADSNLAVVPEYISSVTAASLGCRFITAFRALVDQGHVKENDWVAVHGCGGVGLSAIMIAKAKGAHIIAVDVNSEALQFAKKCGAEYAINAKKEIVIEAIQSITNGGADISVDALGSIETCVNSIECLRKLGKHIQVGLMAGKDHNPPIPMHSVIAKELQLIGSHGMQAFRYPAIFEMIEQKVIHPEILVNSKVNLAQAITHLIGMDNMKHAGITVIDDFD
jgi:alcohol dehydrogenase